MSTILCIDDEPSVNVMLEAALEKIGHRPVLATTVEDGIREIGSQIPDLIISDYQLREGSGLELLDFLRQEGYDIPVIITTGYASVENAVVSMRRGAVDYLTKPLRFEALRIAVNNALEVCRLRRENETYRQEITSLRGTKAIVGHSRILNGVMERIAAVAPTRATVLLEGESGTGKELFARAIHEQSTRRDGPFVTVNCAALPEGLVESTLFGHERGAFTGATARMPGAFERAHNGTLLLDEISEMRLDLQAKLLRSIQEQEFERIGGSQPIKVDVRIVATTNRNLRAEVEAGRFRSDLYYRLSVVPIHSPALRDRLEDVPLLVEHFVRHVARESGIKPPQVPSETIEYLQSLPWPGNIRELANAIERAVILSRSGRLTPDAFGGAGAGLSIAGAGPLPGLLPAAPARLLPGPAFPAPASLPPIEAEAVEEEAESLNLKVLEERMIRRALSATGGHRARAAKLLGISERTLRNKLNGPGKASETEEDCEAAA